MKIDYTLTGIDEDGNLVVDIPMTREQVGTIILEAILSKNVSVVAPSTETEPETEDVLVSVKKKPGKKAKAGKIKGQKICKNCGKPGHIAKTCKEPGSPVAQNEQPSAPREPLSIEQYDDIRAAMHDREFQSGKYSLSHKLSPKEVNAAVRSSTYQNYLDSREQ
jgi:hypothetical protein